MKTFSLKKSDIKKKWVLIDAKDAVDVMDVRDVTDVVDVMME